MSSDSSKHETNMDSTTYAKHISPFVEVESLEEWIGRTRELLKYEQRAEENEARLALSRADIQQLESLGRTVTGLELESLESGLFGRTILLLRHQRMNLLPSHKLSVGDIAGISREKSPQISKKGEPDCRGVIIKVTNNVISIVLDEESSSQSNEDEDGLERITQGSDSSLGALRIDLLANDTTFRRLHLTLNALERNDDGCADRMIQLMFASRKNEKFQAIVAHELSNMKAAMAQESGLAPFNKLLNSSQEIAIRSALGSSAIFMIHGPPGTGKTTTVVELVRQAVSKGLRVLACAPSNIAVDNLVERLAVPVKKSNVKMVRLGHPARITPECLQYSLEACIERSDANDVASDIRRELKDIFTQFQKRRVPYLKRRELRENRRHLAKELKQREKQTVVDVIREANVVCSTISGAGSHTLLRALGREDLISLSTQQVSLPSRKHRQAVSNADSVRKSEGTEKQLEANAVANAQPLSIEFDLVVIDEVAQSTEVACWLPLLLGKQAVIAGDHQQLPPTIKSHLAMEKGLAVTLADRFVHRLQSQGDSSLLRMLDIQYRMHQAINDWSSGEFYKGELVADSSVSKHTLSDLNQSAGNKSASASQGSFELTDEDLASSLCFIDTTGCDADFEEYVYAPNESAAILGSLSKANRGEANICCKYVVALLQKGIEPQAIGVISPYSAQVSLLRSLLSEMNTPSLRTDLVGVNTVDSFQGQEREVIVLSLVRSNDRGKIGFLKDYRRTNVAITRAKRHVCVVCHGDTLRTDAFYSRLLDYFESHGDYRSAEEFTDSVVAVDASVYVPPTTSNISSIPNNVLPNETYAQRTQPTETLGSTLSETNPAASTDSQMHTSKLSSIDTQTQIYGQTTKTSSTIPDVSPTGLTATSDTWKHMHDGASAHDVTNTHDETKIHDGAKMHDGTNIYEVQQHTSTSTKSLEIENKDNRKRTVASTTRLERKFILYLFQKLVNAHFKGLSAAISQLGNARVASVCEDVAARISQKQNNPTEMFSIIVQEPRHNDFEKIISSANQLISAMHKNMLKIATQRMQNENKNDHRAITALQTAQTRLEHTGTIPSFCVIARTHAGGIPSATVALLYSPHLLGIMRKAVYIAAEVAHHPIWIQMLRQNSSEAARYATNIRAKRIIVSSEKSTENQQLKHSISATSSADDNETTSEPTNSSFTPCTMNFDILSDLDDASASGSDESDESNVSSFSNTPTTTDVAAPICATPTASSATTTVSASSTPSTGNSLLAQLAQERKARHKTNEASQRKPNSKASHLKSANHDWVPREMLDSMKNTFKQPSRRDSSAPRETVSANKLNLNRKTTTDKKKTKENKILGVYDFKVNKAALEQAGGDEDLAYLDTVAERMQNRCSVQKCNKRTTAVSTVCRYCRLRFCVKHGLPEEHGCGEDARRDARTKGTSISNGTITASAGSQRTSATHHAYAAKSLRARLQDAQSNRRKQTSETDSKKKTSKGRKKRK